VTRELLYTAVTRARASAAIAADANALASGVQNPTRRVSGLAARLIEAARIRGGRLAGTRDTTAPRKRRCTIATQADRSSPFH
jgi:hypothetical protein